MNETREKFLPIGTVCMLKGGTKRVMVTGFCAVDNADKEKMYDYSGCMYPEGFLSSDQTALFNHEQIEKIFYLGYIDEEETAFKTQLKGIIDKMNNVIPQNNINQEKPSENNNAEQPVITQTIKLDETPAETPLSDIPPIGPGL